MGGGTGTEREIKKIKSLDELQVGDKVMGGVDTGAILFAFIGRENGRLKFVSFIMKKHPGDLEKWEKQRIDMSSVMTGEGKPYNGRHIYGFEIYSQEKPRVSEDGKIIFDDGERKQFWQGSQEYDEIKQVVGDN